MPLMQGVEGMPKKGPECRQMRFKGSTVRFKGPVFAVLRGQGVSLW